MIVVTAPTGQIGSKLVRELLDRGSDVRVIVRDASRLDEDVRDRVEVVEGSHGESAVLDGALPGAEALFWLVPPNPTAPSTEEHYLAFARVASRAIARHQVGHVVGVSSAGHGWPKPAGVLSSAFAMDTELRTSGAAYRALSMPFYLENLLRQLDGILSRGSFSLTGAADEPMPTIATRDIAHAAANLLTALSWSGQDDVPVFGPDRLTPDELAAVMAQRLVRKLCPVCKQYDGQHWHAVGCDKCGHTGYQGRVGVYELLLTNEQINAQIHDRASEAEIRATAQRNGMRTMREDGERWLQQGVTTEAELLRVTKE